MNFHEFKIVTDEKSRSKHIFIDGIEQKGVVSCDIRLRPDEIPTVKLEYMIGHLDTAIAASVVETNKTFTDGFLDLGIEHLEISGRAYNVIKQGNWNTYLDRDFNNTIADVVIAYRTGHLKRYSGMGKKTYSEIITQLKKFGLIAEDDE